MSQIKITLPEVSNMAASLRNHNKKLDDTLSYVSRTMLELNSSWRSLGADRILANFNKFSRVFIDESQAIEEYAKFLDFTVSTYDSIESTISSNAEGFN